LANASSSEPVSQVWAEAEDQEKNPIKKKTKADFRIEASPINKRRIR